MERLVAQCYQLYGSPPLGTLVRAGEAPPVYAVVAGVATTSLDPTRPVVARGADAETEAEVLREHPQLERLLRTDVTLTVVGHALAGRMHHYLPPTPPRVHAFVFMCGPEEVRRFTEKLDFVAMLTKGGELLVDDVLAAALRQASEAYEDGRGFLVNAGRTVATFLGNDTARISAIVRRLPL